MIWGRYPYPTNSRGRLNLSIERKIKNETMISTIAKSDSNERRIEEESDVVAIFCCMMDSMRKRKIPVSPITVPISSRLNPEINSLRSIIEVIKITSAHKIQKTNALIKPAINATTTVRAPNPGEIPSIIWEVGLEETYAVIAPTIAPIRTIKMGIFRLSFSVFKLLKKASGRISISRREGFIFISPYIFWIRKGVLLKISSSSGID
jgi:hypothetical protein